MCVGIKYCEGKLHSAVMETLLPALSYERQQHTESVIGKKGGGYELRDW